jgi:hypothetical protein
MAKSMIPTSSKQLLMPSVSFSSDSSVRYNAHLCSALIADNCLITVSPNVPGVHVAGLILTSRSSKGQRSSIVSTGRAQHQGMRGNPVNWV